MGTRDLNNTRWDHRRLDEILTPEQIREIWRLNKVHGKDETNLLVALKTYFETLRPELLKKGVDARFIAFVVFAKLTDKFIN